MKRTIFILFALIAFMPTSNLLHAQDDLPYRSLKSLNNDTIQYLDYNFTIRNAQYRGKKVSDFLKDLELPIVYFSWEMTLTEGNSNDIPILSAATLGIRQVGNQMEGPLDYYVTISFVEKIPFVDFRKATKFIKKGEYDIPQWTPELQELLKDIEIRGIGTNLRLIKERRDLLKRNSGEELKTLFEKETKEWQIKNRALKK